MLPTISGYEIADNIHKGTSADVYRGFRKNDNLSVIIKIIKDDPQYSYKLSLYKNHYKIVKDLDTDHIVKIYELKRHQGQTVMILEDFDGLSVAKITAEYKLAIEESISFAIEAAKVLNSVHSHNIIHKDINSSHFILNRTTGRIKITNFDFSTTLKQEAYSFDDQNIIEGTVSYMSPEQTGRINRSLDYRTDFYSLGVSLYEWFTGKLPFEKEEALELIYCHIAKQPIPPHDLDDNIPKSVSDIIMKLLEKSSENRYQSAIGVQKDFEECQKQYLEKRTIKSFPLCQYDISVKFNIPEKLYGRSKKLGILTEAVEHVGIGDGMSIFVSGTSGIGKTALIQEIRNSVIMKGGYFVQGKYERFNQDIPFSAFNISFHRLIRQLLTEKEENLKEWKEKILKALGPNGRIVLDILPELELIIGPQPEVPELPPRETRNRFNMVFVSLFSVFLVKGKPFVFFLDDMQWIDNASLQGLELLLKLQKSRLRHFLFIGAYRDDELDGTHRLMRSIETLTREDIGLQVIKLEPLSRQDLNLLLSDTLHDDIKKTADFSKLVFSKTGGNPFFVREFLKKIHEDGLIKFKEGWQWDLSRIREAYVTDNVVALMTNKIVRLPKATLQIIETAACIGITSNITILSIISGKSEDEMFDALTIAIEEGIIIKIEDSIRFVHDRIKNAVYSLIDEADAINLHYRIGKQFLSDYSLEKPGDTLFLISSRIPQIEERIESEKDGKKTYSNITVYPLITNGVEGTVIRIDDITERVRIEEMIIQNEKMMSVGGLAAGMAHEINNPLAGILQNMQVIVNRMSVDLEKNRDVAEACGITMESLKCYMDKRDIFVMFDLVLKSGKRAAQIVDNMLSFSRKSDSRFIRYDLGELLDKAIELAENDYDLKKKYDFRKIEIIREYDGSVPTVPCDESKIQQVFLNILKNGAQEMAMNKREDKEPRFILRVKPDRDMACIEIEDNGSETLKNASSNLSSPLKIQGSAQVWGYPYHISSSPKTTEAP